MSTTYYQLGGHQLTHAELLTISLAMSGITRKQIAHVLGIKLSTVSQRMRFIFTKLDKHSIGELIMWGVKHGLDDCGNLNGIYLFEGNKKVLWKRVEAAD